ncbi:MAG: hypothetical protein IJN23_02995 [Akkermansia sp.]|nr:hypothetical protein [Akkermansia sp.]
MDFYSLIENYVSLSLDAYISLIIIQAANFEHLAGSCGLTKGDIAIGSHCCIRNGSRARSYINVAFPLFSRCFGYDIKAVHTLVNVPILNIGNFSNRHVSLSGVQGFIRCVVVHCIHDYIAGWQLYCGGRAVVHV